MTSETLTMPRRPVAPPAEYEPVVSNTQLAIVIVIVGEAMLFAGLVGMYIVFRLSAPTWHVYPIPMRSSLRAWRVRRASPPSRFPMRARARRRNRRGPSGLRSALSDGCVVWKVRSGSVSCLASPA